MGLFERYLTLWVALGVGVGLGLAHVNLVVAVFIWVQIDRPAVKDVGKKTAWAHLTLVVNWLIKPFTHHRAVGDPGAV